MAITHNYTHRPHCYSAAAWSRRSAVRRRLQRRAGHRPLPRCWDASPSRMSSMSPTSAITGGRTPRARPPAVTRRATSSRRRARDIAEAVARCRPRAEPCAARLRQKLRALPPPVGARPALLRAHPVTIVIPTKDRADCLPYLLHPPPRTVPRESGARDCCRRRLHRSRRARPARPPAHPGRPARRGAPAAPATTWLPLAPRQPRHRPRRHPADSPS